MAGRSGRTGDGEDDMNKGILALATLALAAVAASEAGQAQGHPGPGWRAARCAVTNGANEDWPGTWRGPCYFQSERGGSFGIQPMRGSFPDGSGLITVAVISPGRAEVRVITQHGMNSRWGEARRSSRDRACWVGSDFSVCAY
jgi:hypothetical protein